MTEGFKRTGTCGSSSSARRAILQEAGYIYADCPFAQLQTSCSPTADHTLSVIAPVRVNCQSTVSVGPVRVATYGERARLRLVGAINFLPAAAGEKGADTWVDEAEDRRKYALPPMQVRTMDCREQSLSMATSVPRGAIEAGRN